MTNRLPTNNNILSRIVHFLLKKHAYSVFSSWNKPSLTSNTIPHFINYVNFFILKCPKKVQFLLKLRFFDIYALNCALYFLFNFFYLTSR